MYLRAELDAFCFRSNHRPLALFKSMLDLLHLNSHTHNLGAHPHEGCLACVWAAQHVLFLPLIGTLHIIFSNTFRFQLVAGFNLAFVYLYAYYFGDNDTGDDE